MGFKFKTIDVTVPVHDCDVVLLFPSGKTVTIQCRPSNADLDYNGSLDVILPSNRVVTCWKGDNMEPSTAIRDSNQEIRLAKQIVTELP